MSIQPQLRKASTAAGEEVVKLFQLTEDDLADVPALAEEFFSVTNRRIPTVGVDILSRLVRSPAVRLGLLTDELKGKLTKDDIRQIRTVSSVVRPSHSVADLQSIWTYSVEKLPDMIALLERFEAMATDEVNETVRARVLLRRYHNALERLTADIPAAYPLVADFVHQAFLVTNPDWPVRREVRPSLVELDEKLRTVANARDRYFVYRTSEGLELFLEEALAWRELALTVNLSISAKAFLRNSKALLARIEAASLMELSWS